jgi:cell division cycle 20-like protein 1 (cofactor of APC complex)
MNPDFEKRARTASVALSPVKARSSPGLRNGAAGVSQLQLQLSKLDRDFDEPTSPTSPRTPVTSPRRKSMSSYSDRFIPVRSESTRNTLQSELHSPSKKRVEAQLDSQKEANATYEKVVKNEILGASPTTPSSTGSNMLRFRSPTKQSPVTRVGTWPLTSSTNQESSPIGPVSPSKFYQNIAHPMDPRYSTSALSSDSQRLLASPRKTPRYISKTPYKVLDAPELVEDFYLNLVDWGSNNHLAVGLGSVVYLWSASNASVKKLCDLGHEPVTSVSWNQSSSHVTVGSNDGTVRLYDVTSMEQVRETRGKLHSSRVGTIAWNRDTFVTGGRDKNMFMVDVRAPQMHVRQFQGHKSEVCGTRWNPDGDLLASGGNDNRLFVWDTRQDRPLWRFTDHVAAVKAMAWSPHKRGLLASGGGTADRKIRFWNTSNGNCINVVDTGSQVCNLAWSRFSEELVSTHGYSQQGSNQNHVTIWNYGRMSQMAVLTGHTFRVVYLSCSPDGQSIVTGAGDETLRFWNVFSKVKNREDKRSVLSPFGSIR